MGGGTVLAICGGSIELQRIVMEKTRARRSHVCMGVFVIVFFFIGLCIFLHVGAVTAATAAASVIAL